MTLMCPCSRERWCVEGVGRVSSGGAHNTCAIAWGDHPDKVSVTYSAWLRDTIMCQYPISGIPIPYDTTRTVYSKTEYHLPGWSRKSHTNATHMKYRTSVLRSLQSSVSTIQSVERTAGKFLIRLLYVLRVACTLQRLMLLPIIL